MGQERDAAYYDEAFAGNQDYARAPDDAPWAPLWLWLASRLGGESVLDLGCGPGHLASLLQGRQLPPNRYLGVDFSAEAIRQARERAPGYLFEQATLREGVARAKTLLPGFTAVLCEVLEHVTGDVAVLEAMPPGTRVLATVPSYDSPGHVRHFKTFQGVCKRYERALRLVDVVRIGRCYGFEGVRP